MELKVTNKIRIQVFCDLGLGSANYMKKAESLKRLNMNSAILWSRCGSANYINKSESLKRLNQLGDGKKIRYGFYYLCDVGLENCKC